MIACSKEVFRIAQDDYRRLFEGQVGFRDSDNFVIVFRSGQKEWSKSHRAFLQGAGMGLAR